jgi:hypothetical protein
MRSREWSLADADAQGVEVVDYLEPVLRKVDLAGGLTT